jgi:hypothetical protein
MRLGFAVEPAPGTETTELEEGLVLESLRE